jgi:hypothetical protein
VPTINTEQLEHPLSKMLGTRCVSDSEIFQILGYLHRFYLIQTYKVHENPELFEFDC